MNENKSSFWTNLAVTILGILVGLDNLFSWLKAGDSMDLLLALVCLTCAVIWGIFSLLQHKKN